MNKIDEQPSTGSHSPGEVVKISSSVAPSVPNSRPIASEAAAVLSIDLRSEHDASIQFVESKTTSRRAWLRRGVAVASPVVATLVSAPVYGACVNLNPSGFVSATTFASRHPGEMVCTFFGPNYWHTNLGAWPTSSPDTTNANFVDVIGPAFGVDAAITSSTKLDAVLGGNFSLLAKYCIAAYLNARSGTSGFPLTALQASEVYKSYRGGPFSTLLVTGWTETQTVAWLQILMT